MNQDVANKPYSAAEANILNNFESLGANCEFGFVQEKPGADVATIFRWAGLPSISVLTEVIRNDFKDVYQFDNLEPYNAGMVRDKLTGISWHSVIRSQMIDPDGGPGPENFRFANDLDQRRKLYDQEIGKVQHLLRKTRESLRTGKRIFVYKPLIKQVVTDADLRELLAVLNQYRRSDLLYVSVATEKQVAGTIDTSGAGWLAGYVDRFAPGRNARDISYEYWLQICTAALASARSKLAHTG